jgi:TPR repeat protein
MKLRTTNFQKGMLVFLMSLGILFFTQNEVSARFDEGLVAYDRGDYATALKEWRPLAEAGEDRAQHALGVMYERGQGVIQDYKEALKWFTKAAEQGYAAAQFNLGLMFHEGRGVTQDYKEALSWFNKAAEQGYAPAQNSVGAMFATGQGTPQDYVSAYVWFQLAATSGSQDAVRNRDAVKKHLTRSQIEQAQRIAKDWEPQKSK